ncbi:hypothetical protein [Aquimarina sp. 2201CG14-23]|uniref:hypothetical protein n=1 Tax=Aquimarina mycalae TaxID=3040073 RepID=UPI002477FE2E|nr:hypothetical protein [Aquimarina sp. 2201CG14-23]MDH7447181.1 hypothetical protein [Aquimarina sp. 2201CG14-23]
MKTKLTLFILVTILLSSCAAKIPLSSNYYESNSKVGLLLNINEINASRTGNQGIIDLALTQGIKYKEPLKIVDQQLNAKQRIQDLYKNTYSTKGKDLILIKDSINFNNFKKFEVPKDKKANKYAKHDIRELKTKYNIDELLIINVNYGLLVSYYSMIETGRSGNCTIHSTIVNLNDNSLLYKDFSFSLEKINGKWKTPPKYENLFSSINAAITETLSKEKTKFNK